MMTMIHSVDYFKQSWLPKDNYIFVDQDVRFIVKEKLNDLKVRK